MIRRTAIAAGVAAAFPGFALAQGVARVDFAIGNASAIGTDGRSRPLSKGTEIGVGDTVDTGLGRVQLRFADGAQMALQPDTQFKVEQFVFASKGEGEDNVVMNLLKGGMRTVTGLIGRANRAKYQLKTPSATIGIRGTEFTAEYRDALRAFCAQGLIFLANDGGTLLLSGGQGAFVSSFTSAPTRNDTPPTMPTISQQDMLVLLKLAGVNPQNAQQDFNPVVTLQTALAQLATVTVSPTTPAPAPTPTPTPTPKPTRTASLLAGDFTGNWGARATSSALNARYTGLGQALSMDAAGNLIAFTDAAQGAFGLGTAAATSLGNDGTIAWGTWSNGTTTGAGDYARALAGNDRIHYVVGLPVASMPVSGTASYNMLGSSASCSGAGCTSATVNSSSLSVNFGGSPTVSVAMSLTVNGSTAGTYTRSGTTGTLNSNGSFSVGGTLTGGPAPSGCNSFAGNGFLSGAGAVRAGLQWNGTLVGGTIASGVAAYVKQ